MTIENLQRENRLFAPSPEFAAAALRSEFRGALFLRLDGKDYRPGLWQQARPAGDTKVTEE